MTKKIDKYCFDKNFEQFKNFVENKDNLEFSSFSSSHYLNNEEGYKDKIYNDAREKLNYWEWKQSDIGTGKIARDIINAIELENNLNNLVDWRVVDKFQNNIVKKQMIINREQYFFDFYNNYCKEKEFFEYMLDSFGKLYALIAYFFFIKDNSKFLPVSTDRFQNSLQELGVSSFKLSYKCSWDNYVHFIDLIKQVQVLLSERGLEVTLLNAHSFVWLLDEKKQEIQDVIKNKKHFDDLDNYKKLKPKQKEQVILARTGQGIFRKSLINYWQKCSVTGCKKTELLIASHIKAFSSCSDEEAIDGQNGLLLIPNLDKLFDKCLISFDDDGKIIISYKLDEKTKNTFNITSDMCIHKKLNSKQKEYLKYHRKKLAKTIYKHIKNNKIS